VIADLSWAALALIALVVFVGVFVQSAVGVGSGMVGTPVIALFEPALVPTLLLVVTIQISVGVLLSEHRHINWRALGWSLPPRIPGTVLGVWLVTTLSASALGAGIAGVVLMAVWVAWRALELPQMPVTLASAGFASGVTGTAAAIDGPPMVILMAHRPAGEVRATMSLFFVVGAVLSLAGFAWHGALPTASLWIGAACLPLVALAVPLGGRAARSLPRETFRRAVLGVCALSAIILLVKSVG
jgi:uncharacterized membrane protein YfcA